MPLDGFFKLKFPIKGSHACNIISTEYLNSFERTEVEEFEEVWYVAPEDKKF
jgi:hypothetical protein